MAIRHSILAIDDDPHILEELEDTIRSLGHTSLKASNQVEAQEILRKRQTCLALLDLELKMDHKSAQSRIQVGFNLLEEIRRQKTKDEFPVILITAHKGENDGIGIRALRSGANDLVKKPFTNGELEDRIRLWLGVCALHKRADKSGPGKSSQENGSDLKTNDTIRFVGSPNTKQRNLILVNGNEAWVRPQTIEVLWNLSLPLWERRDGWMKAIQIITDRDNPHQAIMRAREDLKKYVKDPKRTIENNSHQYRLSTPSENITYDEKLMNQYFPRLFEKLKTPQTNLA